MHHAGEVGLFSIHDVAPAINYSADPFEDHHWWHISMPYGPGYGKCWTVADERPTVDWVLEEITTVARRTSYEVACGRMLGSPGMRLGGCA